LERCRNAERRSEALWVQAACLTGAAALAWLTADRLAWSGNDLEEARRLGVISATTLAGYAKSRDTHAYLIAMTVAVLAAISLWIAWCLVSGRRRKPAPAEEMSDAAVTARSWRWTEVALIAAVLLPGLLRLDLATNGWDAPYTFYAEEGQAVAWADVALRGGVLSQDTYCLYGPLATFPVVAAFKIFGPSVRVWRLCLYLLDLPALLAIYVLLRELSRTRLEAWLGVALVCFHRMWPMPGMSWSLMRTAFGLAAIAAVLHFLRYGRRAALVVCGASLGAGLFFSQEAGVAAALAVASALAFDPAGRGAGWRDAGRQLLFLVVGFSMTAVPVVAYYAARGAVSPMFENLFGFARLRMLGHGGQPFPNLLDTIATWTSSPSDATREALLETLAVYFGPALYAFTAFRIGAQTLAGRYAPHLAAQLALVVYGSVLFFSPLSRPDTTHVLFAMPPAFVLAVDLLARAVARVSGPGTSLPVRTAVGAFAIVTLAGLATFRGDTVENVQVFARQVAWNVTGRGYGAADEGARALDLPRGGGVRIPEDRAAEIEAAVRYVENRTGPNEPVWAFPGEPMLNFLADRPLAGPYALALFAITRDQRLALIDAVERSGARYAIVNEKATIVDGIASREQVPELWEFLDERFVAEQRFGRLVVMSRTSERPPP
jgi:hypothetical protein